MDLNKLTQKSQEALSDAQNKAITRGHTEVDGEHLLLALIEQEQGLIPRLLQKIDVPADAVRTAVETELEQRPRISGPGVEPGKIYLSQRLSKLLVEAERQASRLKDEYVSTEHIFMGLIDECHRPGYKVHLSSAKLVHPGWGRVGAQFG